MKCLEYWSLVSIGYLVNVSAGHSAVDTVHGEVECPGQKERGAAVLCPKDVRACASKAAQNRQFSFKIYFALDLHVCIGFRNCIYLGIDMAVPNIVSLFCD